MNDFIHASILGCQAVKMLIERGESSLYTLHEQGAGGDISNGIDLKAEALLFSHLSSFGSIFSEESGWMSSESSTTIFLDPIDGSDNFISHLPYYGVSIARVIEGETSEALVCNLVNGDLFIRTRDEYYRTSLTKTSFERVRCGNRE